MAKKNSCRFRLVYRRSPLLLKCVVLATIVFSIAALTVIRMDISQWQAQAEYNRVYAAQLEQENDQLEEKLRQKDTVDGIREIARDELGLEDPDAVFFKVVTNQD